MITNKIPSILFQPYGNSLSIERVLKNSINVLEQCDIPEHLECNRENAISDLQDMLKALDRG